MSGGITYRNAPAKNAHWAIHIVYANICADGMTYKDFQHKAKIPRVTMKRIWDGEVMPRIDDLERMLAIFGYSIKIKQAHK